MATTVVWEPDQRGAWSVGGSDWTDVAQDDTTGDLTLQPSTTYAGLVFDATGAQTLQFATVGSQSRILDAPILGEIPTLAFYITRVGGAAAVSLELGLVREAAPSDYSDSAGPWNRDEVSLGTYDLGTAPNYPNTLQVTVELSDAAQAYIRATLAQVQWVGQVAISLRAPASTNTFRVKNGSSYPIELTTSQTRFFSGLAGGYTPGVRAVRDSRYGIPTLSSNLVRDGDNEALWVRSSDADPDDPPNRFVPDPREGMVDDQIPD